MFWLSKRSVRTSEAVEETKSSTVSTLAEPSPELLSLFGIAPSTSGVSITPDNCMRVPAVRAAVYAISEGIGQVEANLYTTGDNASLATDHPAYPLLHDAANDWTSAPAFREQLTFDALRWGNGYAAISRDGDGKPIELHRLAPERMTPKINVETQEPVYQYAPIDGALTEYSFRDVFHLRGPSINGIFGDSAVRECAEAIASSVIMERQANALFANGAKPAGLLSTLKTVGEEVKANITRGWKAAFSGSNAGGLGFLEGGLTYQQVALSSVDAQFLELRQFAIGEVSRIFRISPILLGEMGRATWSNSEEMGRQFVALTLMPWVIRWQKEAELKLFDPADRGKYRVELNTDDFVIPDLAARAQAYATMIAARVMNPNEARAKEGLPSYVGGDVYLNPNTTTETVNVS